MIQTTFEERLEKIIAVLPSHKSGGNEFPIRFNWGTQDKLNAFIALPENVSKYPLIWLIEGEDEENNETMKISRNAEIIIATQSLGVSRFNPEIYLTDYKEILNPVKRNLIYALKCSGISKIDSDYKLQRFKDYKWSENSNNTATCDIWNVILLKANITFHKMNCSVNKKIF